MKVIHQLMEIDFIQAVIPLEVGYFVDGKKVKFIFIMLVIDYIKSCIAHIFLWIMNYLSADNLSSRS